MITWKRIPEFRDYFISEHGDIYSTLSSGVMKSSTNKAGYKSIPLRLNGSYRGRFIHRLVASAFIGDSDKQVNHIDGDKTNNNIGNLEYCTQSENQMHALKTGLRALKYPRVTVDVILDMRKQGLTQKAIADILDVKLSFVKDVSGGRTRKQL